MPETPEQILAEREHEIYAGRKEQMNINLLGLRGGKPYIESRLSRFPGERESQWSGRARHLSVTASTGTARPTANDLRNIFGRKDRASLVNHCGRIGNKINQYVFRTLPRREGLDEEVFANDVTLTGKNINEFWSFISQIVTAVRWCWVCVDSPSIPNIGEDEKLSVFEARSRGIRPYWAIWLPTEVPDWRFSDNGDLEWLITESFIYDNSDPFSKTKKNMVRSLWQPGLRTDYVFKEDAAPAIERIVEVPTGMRKVPFVTVGEISSDPWWFDSVESINRVIMDLESITDQNIFDAVFPILIVPKSLSRSTMNRPNASLDEVIDTVIGTRTAIGESPEESGITRFVVPPKADLNFIREEINSKKKDLFDVVGMSLRIETRQVESAEAKQWGNLDAESVLIERANILEEAERKLVEKTKDIDGSFAEYEPVYQKKFDISDLKEDMEALILGNQINVGAEGRKEISKAAIELLAKKGLLNVDEKRIEEVVQAIEDENFEDLSFQMNKKNPDEEEDEESDTESGARPSVA